MPPWGGPEGSPPRQGAPNLLPSIVPRRYDTSHHAGFGTLSGSTTRALKLHLNSIQFDSIQFYYYTSILLHLNLSATADYAVAACMASSAPHGEGPCALRRAPRHRRRHRHRPPCHRPPHRRRRRQASSTSSPGCRPTRHRQLRLQGLPAQVSPQGRKCGKTPALHPSVTPSLHAATASGSTSGF